MLKFEVDSLVFYVLFLCCKFMQVVFGGIFVVVVLFVLVQMVMIDSVGLDVDIIEICLGDVSVLVYCVQLVDKMNLLVVIVIYEIFGVYVYIVDVCWCFVKFGYLVIVLDLFV